jgi:hypothetical protein
MSLIFEKADVSPEVIEKVEPVFDNFFADSEKIDWFGFCDRLDEYGVEIQQMDAPALVEIKKIVRRLRNQS